MGVNFQPNIANSLPQQAGGCSGRGCGRSGGYSGGRNFRGGCGSGGCGGGAAKEGGCSLLRFPECLAYLTLTIGECAVTIEDPLEIVACVRSTIGAANFCYSCVKDAVCH